MEENQVIEEINEGAVNAVCEEVSNSNGNLIAKLVVGTLVVAAGVGAFIFYKKRKNKYCELKAEDVVVESQVIDNDDSDVK